MFFNDEWITGNQLHQLSKGSQILYNEGKYGFYENGTPFNYFVIRNNSLPYSSYLPLLSLPFLWIVSTIGDNIPYLFTIIWISLVLILFIQIRKNVYFTDKMRFYILMLIFVFFILNLKYYNPFNIAGESNNSEILAIVLYHIIIYSALCLIVYLINLSLFSNDIQSIFGTVTSICCTSALFWTTTLKDHLDIIFLIALLIYSIILHVKTKDSWYGIVSFVISGLILWVRPEFGAFIFLSLLFVYYPIILKNTYNQDMRQFLLTLISPLSAIIGAIPLFLNNYFVMGNPLKFPWQLASDYIIVKDETHISSITNVTNSEVIEYSSDIIQNIFSLIFHRMTPGGDITSGLFSAFLYPETLKVPVFALAPLILLIVLLSPIIIPIIKKELSSDEKFIIIMLSTISIFTVLAYFTSISGLSISKGIYPDVRYLSPLYLPLNIIGLILLMKLNIDISTIQKMIKYIFIISFSGVVFVLVITAVFNTQYSYSDYFLWINVITSTLVFISLLISFVTLSLKYLGIYKSGFYLISLSFMIALPFIWQVSQLIIINYADNLFDQYPPLLPAVRTFFEYISVVPPD